MKNLGTLEKLIRLKSKSLDTRRQFVGKLLGRAGEIEQEIQTHKTSLQNEQENAAKTLDGMMAFTNYTTSVLEKVERLERLHREVQAQLQKEQDKLKDLYADLHVHEKVLETAQQREKEALEKKEQNILDDLYGASR